VRKDKKKVVGEPMTDEQVAVFLGFRPQGDESVDHYLLARAYRSLRAHDFVRFLSMFQAAGHDVNAQDAKGRTLMQIISEHEQAEEYVAALLEAGAQPA
jgi:ankyrin repeat protein